MSKLSAQDQIRIAAENSLESFITLVAPYRVLGNCHRELIQWWEREEALRNQLVLMPRDHGKSAMVAYRVAHRIVKDPTVRIIYLSSTSGLAVKQIRFIKDILESPTVRRYWPELVNPNPNDRAKWTTEEVIVDHPLRAAEGISDATLKVAGLTTSITGLHCDVAVFDDMVVMENAYTEEGRSKVKTQYSLLASIAGAEAEQWVVGTRYHPLDLYSEMQEMHKDRFNEDGEIIGSDPVYEIWERKVEDRGDGAGEFLWPRQQRADGKWFGFNREILAEKRAMYLDKNQFYAQYYNNPNMGGEGAVDRALFQYYDKKYLHRKEGYWYFKNHRLNVFAAIDFAYTVSKKSDYTALVIVGITANRDIYILDIERFKTKSIREYYERILKAHITWGFRKIRAEVTAAQVAIVNELKSSYIKPNGLALAVDEFKPTRHLGTKEERIRAVLNPRYENNSIWHYDGGNIQTLEEELVQEFPAHDDIKDALASAIEIAIPPGSYSRVSSQSSSQQKFHSRFGGVSH